MLLRRTFLVACIVLTVFLAAVDFRTYFASDSLCLSHGASDEWLMTNRGYVILQHAGGIPASATRQPGHHSSGAWSINNVTWPVLPTWVAGHGFLHYGGGFPRANGTPIHAWVWICPLWQAVLLAGIYPGVAFYQWISRVRTRRPGTCPRCGYDLRATPDRCPECGTAIAQTPAGSASL